MALQLKNKAKEDKPVEGKKNTGKYKRKRNVFGKSLTRFGLIGLIIGLVVIFATVKVVFTLNQNKRISKVNEEYDIAKAKNDDLRLKIAAAKKQAKYENVGELIATLPANFDKQALSKDLDRIVSLSGLSEVALSRSISPDVDLPFNCSVSTVKAVKITMSLSAGIDNDIDDALTFIKYLINYDLENFYYIETFSYSVANIVTKQSTFYVEFYTFYNDVNISNQTTTTTATTTTK